MRVIGKFSGSFIRLVNGISKAEKMTMMAKALGQGKAQA